MSIVVGFGFQQILIWRHPPHDMMALLIASNYEVRLVAELQSSRFDEAARFNIQGNVAGLSSFKLAKLDQKIPSKLLTLTHIAVAIIRRKMNCNISLSSSKRF